MGYEIREEVGTVAQVRASSGWSWALEVGVEVTSQAEKDSGGTLHRS